MDGDENGGVIFIQFGARRVHGELLRKCRAIWYLIVVPWLVRGRNLPLIRKCSVI